MSIWQPASSHVLMFKVNLLLVIVLTGNSDGTGWPRTWNTQGFLWTWKSQGSLREFCATSGKNCNKQSILVCHGQSVVVTCYIAGIDVEWPSMKVLITFTFRCDNLWKSKFMALEKPGKLREFLFSYFLTTLWKEDQNLKTRITDRGLRSQEQIKGDHSPGTIN